MKLRSILISLALLAMVTACGGGSPTVTQAPNPATAAAPTQAPASQASVPTQAPISETPAPIPSEPAASTPVAGGTGTTVHLVVTGGPIAGTYDSSGEKSDCNISSTGSGASFVDLGASEGVGSLTFSAIEGGTSPTKFYFQVLFAPVTALNPPSLQISTLDPNTADGTATTALEDKGATIKWTINGTTEDGTGVAATIECGPVDRS